MRLRLRILAALAALATLVAAAPAHAVDAATLRSRLTAQIASAGAASGAYARDLTSGADLVAVRPDSGRIPASVEKLFVTATALLRFGPAERLTTRVVTDGVVDELGVLRGDVWLVGGGDPELGEADLDALAAAVRAAGVARLEGGVVGDESLFDTLRGGPRTGFRVDGDIGGRLGALVLGRGRQGRPAAYAAQRFSARLRAAGVRVGRAARTGTAPEPATELAVDTSPPIATLARHTNGPSDNWLAEMLLKDLGAAFGASGSTASGAAVVRQTLDDLGVRPRISDGSGLSRANRASPRDVVRLFEAMEAGGAARAFRRSLAVAGRSGTVRLRMRGTAAQGRCRVKTGTIIGVSNLAGTCTTTGGRRVAFAWLMNRVNPYGARAIQDRMTALLARYAPEG